MATTTTNLGLTKPDAAENYDIGVFNGNADTLDAAHVEVGVALDTKVRQTEFDARAAAVDASLNSIANQLDGSILTAGGLKNWNSGNLIVESGTWTPYLGGTEASNSNVYAQQVGRYKRIGDTMHIWGRVSLTSFVASSITGGNICIKGLPATVIGVGALAIPVAIGLCRYIQFPTTFVVWSSYIEPGTATIVLMGTLINADMIQMLSYITNSTTIAISATYPIA